MNRELEGEGGVTGGCRPGETCVKFFELDTHGNHIPNVLARAYIAPPFKREIETR